MEYINFGAVFDEHGAVTDATKGFMRENPEWYYAQITVPTNTVFPADMLRYDCCEVNPCYEHMVDGLFVEPRYIVVRRKQTQYRKMWSTLRWASFGTSCEIISGFDRKPKQKLTHEERAERQAAQDDLYPPLPDAPRY